MAYPTLCKLLVSLVVTIMLRCQPTLQALTCSHGIHTPTQVADGQVLNLRLGETLFFHCEGDTNLHIDLTMRGYSSNCDSTVADTKQLNYTWVCEASNSGSMVIWGFGKNSNAVPLLKLSIRVHDLGHILSLITTSPPSKISIHSTTTTSTSNSSLGGVMQNNQEANPSSDNDVTTRDAKTPVSVAFETILCWQVAVGVLIFVVIVLIIVIIVMAVKHYQTCRGKSNDLRVEEASVQLNQSCRERSQEQRGGEDNTQINNDGINEPRLEFNDDSYHEHNNSTDQFKV